MGGDAALESGPGGKLQAGLEGLVPGRDDHGIGAFPVAGRAHHRDVAHPDEGVQGVGAAEGDAAQGMAEGLAGGAGSRHQDMDLGAAGQG